MEPIPEQSDNQLGFEPATPGSRLLARLIDAAIGFGVFIVILISVVGIYDVELSAGQDEIVIPDGGEIVLRWATIVIWGLYEVLLVHGRGQTVGKMVAKIKVISTTGDGPPATSAASIRWGVLALPPILIPDLLLGLVASFLVGLWFTIDGNRQGLHDKAASTYVVKVPQVVDG
jgi:uncharacterized RDD family membrane protein YckC